ncbi:MAG: hypothetical protein ACYSTW_11250 [Planctomycetota bacterium]
MNGCSPFMSIGSYEGDVSHISRAWGGYEPGAYYQIRKPLFLWKTTDGTSIRIMAVPAGPMDQLTEEVQLPADIPTLVHYQQSPHEWQDILCILPAGTQIRCARVIKEGVWPKEGRLFYYAMITDGQYQGLEIEINALSQVYDCGCSPITFKPDPDLLAVLGKMSNEPADLKTEHE